MADSQIPHTDGKLIIHMNITLKTLHSGIIFLKHTNSVVLYMFLMGPPLVYFYGCFFQALRN